MKADKGISIKALTGIHNSEEFITKRHFDEFVNKILSCYWLQVKILEDGLSKQTTTHTLGEKLTT